jgi:hypothetical protein
MIHITGQKYHDKIAGRLQRKARKPLVFLPFQEEMKKLFIDGFASIATIASIIF